MTSGNRPGSVGSELRRRPYLIGFLIALAGLTFWALLPHPKRDIRQVIRTGKRIIQEREVERLPPLLAASFRSPHTGDREATIERLADTFKYVLSIEIRIKRARIHVHDNEATADVEFRISGSMRGGDVYSEIPFRGLSGSEALANPLERCRLTFVKESDGYWRISGAELLGPAPVKTETSS